MAMGKAVVSTPQAFEGIRAAAGDEIVVAGSAETFADEVIGLLRDPGRARAIGNKARARVVSDYAWEANLRVLDRVLALLSEPDPSPVPAGRTAADGLAART